jgi:hypothetical protein
LVATRDRVRADRNFINCPGHFTHTIITFGRAC